MSDTTIEWIKEVNKTLRELDATMDGKISDLHRKVDEVEKVLLSEIAKNREEFVVFRTRINTRTALISTAIGLCIAIASILMRVDWSRFSKHDKETTTEIVDKTITNGIQPGYNAYRAER